MSSSCSTYRSTSRVLDYEAVLMSSSPNVLCLGMVFAHDKVIPKRGQEFRDHIRCQALRNQGYKVYTLDDKHDDSEIEEHCRANFADTRRMINSMKAKWSDESIKFNHIILDYFFSPIGWARERWNERFFYSTLPALANEGMLAENGTIWLPNLSCITEPIDRHMSTLETFFDVFFVENPKKNPLYRATNLVDKDLLRCPDALTNETQMRPLYAHSDQPFIALVLKKDWDKKNINATPPSSPRKVKRKIEETFSEEDTSGLRRSPRFNRRRALLAF